MTRFADCRNTDLLSVLAGCGCPCMQRVPSRAVPCVEERVTGSNILRDPGFENHVANVGSGEIIQSSSSASQRATAWGEQSDAGQEWDVVSTSPDAGTYHARTTFASGAGGNSANWIEPIMSWDCIFNLRYGAIVLPGDLVTFSIRARASQVASGSPTWQILMDFNASNWDSISSAPLSSGLLTTSYATYTHAEVAPANSHFMRVFYWPKTLGTAGSTDFDFDSCTLSVA